MSRRLGVDEKREREKQVVSKMIDLYCHKKHKTKGEICADCKALKDYAQLRSSKCPFMETKTFCYKPQMREKIREIMRFSGPKMIFYHPVMAVSHLIESGKEKKQLANLANKD